MGLSADRYRHLRQGRLAKFYDRKMLRGKEDENRIAWREMFPEAELLPHLICSRPMFIGGANDEADQDGCA
jgi:hypothetical protein